MAIQNRRGAYVDLNPAKAVPGELLVVQSGDPNTTDGKSVYITFGTGDIKRLATDSDVATMVANATDEIVQDLEDTVEGYAERAETAATSAESILESAEATIEAKGAEQIAAVEAQGAETIASIPQDYTALSDDVTDLKSATSLHDDEIDNTVQTITFGSDGSVQKIEHKRNNVIIRTDTFAFATNMITEVRTLNTGETLTIATNLTTLETTVTYAAA